MLPLCDSHSMLMPANSCMTGIPHIMVPMMPVQPTPIVCPPNNINMCLSTTMTNKYDSRMYGRFRHVGRDQPSYRHAPFDWYRPPKQRYDVVHEDAAVITLDGPMPIGDFYRYYIYGEGIYDDGDDTSSYESEESSYEPRGSSYRRPNRVEPYFNDDEERNSNQQSTRTNNYSTLDPNRRSTNLPLSNYQRNRPSAHDDDDTASINSTYGN